VSRPPIPGFVVSSKDSDDLPSMRTKEGFDRNAYKLMEKVGYDFQNPATLGKVVEVKPHGLNEIQKKIQEQGGSVGFSKVGLGFTPPQPVRISGRRKDKKVITQHISAEEVNESEEESASPKLKPSVFDRLQSPTPRKCPLVFTRIGKGKGRKVSVFNEIKDVPQKRRSLFARIKTGEDSSSSHLQQEKSSVFSCFGIMNEVQSSIPSCIKRFSSLDVKTDGSLRVKRRTMIFTGQQNNSDSSNEAKEVEIVPSNHITAHECEDSDSEIELAETPKTFEDGGQATVDELKELNLGTNDEPRPIYVSSFLTPEEEKQYSELLSEYKDVFAWSYKEMPGLDPKVAVHRLSIKKGISPKKQPQRRFHPELVPEIEKEVNKLIEAGFVREVKYPTWIANVVPVRKKNGQLRICVDFRDLNDACPKDDFLLPVTELMIDSTTGHEALSFMDCTAGYNQILMAPEDQEATAFRTPKGIFCYKVMPFGLKNAGATYQRAMQTVFDDMLHKKVECYVDDLVVKSKKRADHLQDLCLIFERLRKCQLKMNPLKCAFGVTSGKFLGFVVHHRGIEIDQ